MNNSLSKEVNFNSSSYNLHGKLPNYTVLFGNVLFYDLFDWTRKH